MAKKRILLIDDEATLTRLLALNLQQAGDYEVRTENQGSHGLAAALAFRPDLVLLDVVMPDMSGGEVAAQIGHHPRLKETVVVFMTAIVSKQEAEKNGGLIGGHPFVAKPVSTEELVAFIEQQLEGRAAA